MIIIYNTAIYFYRIILRVLAPFNKKAYLWTAGRKNFFSRWENFDAGERKVIWIHCSSLGEFEQGRPLIERIGEAGSHYFILLTFFSPSGYEIRKNYTLADAVCYLPDDTPANAEKFIRVFKPDIAVFVKYEFWHNYISELHKKNIPLYLVSANFRPGQIFFRWYGKWFTKMLRMFNHIFVQSEASLDLLKSAGIRQVTVAGDTRFDRVHAISNSITPIPVADSFSGNRFTIIAGSTWPADHNLLIRLINETGLDVKLIIAPHEIDENEIKRMMSRITKKKVRYSDVTDGDPVEADVLIIDNIGMLSSLYAYGRMAYIGGGFGKGIHNILEACTFCIPVIFGPNYKKFREARELVNAGGAFPVSNYDEFLAVVAELVDNEELLEKAGSTSCDYVKRNTGASRLIYEKILRTKHAE